MSHTVSTSYQSGEVLIAMRFVSLTIIDYSIGGEAVTAAEINALVVRGVFPATCTQNSLGKILLPILVGNKIILAEDLAGSIVEIPSTVGLNANIVALVVVNQ